MVTTKKSAVEYTTMDEVRSHLFSTPTPAPVPNINVSTPELTGAFMAERTLSKLGQLA